MVEITEAHVRASYLLLGVVALALLKRPLDHPNRPGSRWVGLTIIGLWIVLSGVGLYYFVTSETLIVAVFTAVIFGVTLGFLGWLLIAVEFFLERRVSNRVVSVVGLIAGGHLVLLVTNFFWVHEWIYRTGTTVDPTGGIIRDVGPLFWVHVAGVYLCAAVGTGLFVASWASASGLRRRQAGTLALALVPVFVVNVLWFTEAIAFPFDPTPAGTAAGVFILTWALYHTEFLELTPVARRSVVDEMDDAVVLLDTNDRVIDWNPAATDLFEMETAWTGMPATAFFKQVPDSTLAAFADATETETEVTVRENGTDRQFWVTISRIENEQRVHLGRSVIIREITELKRREQQLRTQNKYLDEFASIVSHDLQGPLMGIRANTDIALQTEEPSHAKEVIEAVDRMDALVGDLLALARSGERVAEPESVVLASLAEDAWRQVWTPDATVEIASSCQLRADPSRLRQLLENLFRNAVEHNTEKHQQSHATDGSGEPTLTVTVGCCQNGFYVADDGVGIPQSEREQIFERGYTTDSAGTGLGLSIVAEIADAHGWEVRATSSKTGGARIEITGVERAG